jgi:hypothetical protein
MDQSLTTVSPITASHSSLLPSLSSLTFHTPFSLPHLAFVLSLTAVYHWIGEAFTGAWRVYTNLFTKNSIPLQAIPDPDRFIFMHVDDHMFDYEDLSTWEGGWRDRQGLNLWYTKKLL